MKHRLERKQQEILLNRHAGQTRLAPLPERHPNMFGRVALETFSGLVLGIPLGISAYYVTIVVVYYPVMLCLLFAGWAFGPVFHIPASSVDVFEQELNFGPLIDVLLASLATVSCFYFTRGTIRQGYRVFACVQLPLMLPVVLILFYLTLVHHKPLLPFYGQ